MLLFLYNLKVAKVATLPPGSPQRPGHYLATCFINPVPGKTFRLFLSHFSEKRAKNMPFLQNLQLKSDTYHFIYQQVIYSYCLSGILFITNLNKTCMVKLRTIPLHHYLKLI